MGLTNDQREILADCFARRPDLRPCEGYLLAALDVVIASYANRGTLFLCGNGGSQADAIHIAGELLKSFERKRPLPDALGAALLRETHGADLAGHLEAGLRAHALGLNPALKTAVENDIPLPGIAFAQEFVALARPGDVLLAISTSGNAVNCHYAVSAAKALDCPTILFTGPRDGRIAPDAGIVVRAPGDSTKAIQEAHSTLWHTLCLLIEAQYFTERRG